MFINDVNEYENFWELIPHLIINKYIYIGRGREINKNN